MARSPMVSAELALYPLREPHLSMTIRQFVATLEQQEDLRIEPGRMSTLVTGPADTLFPAIQQAFAAVSEEHEVVLRLVISNACPYEPA